MHFDPHAANVRESDFSTNQSKSTLRIAKAIITMRFPKSREPWLLSCFSSTKKCLKRLIQITHRQFSFARAAHCTAIDIHPTALVAIWPEFF
jgi:hypothetical protein